MSAVRWSTVPLPDTADWPDRYPDGECVSCGRHTRVWPDPYVQQDSCRPCWEAFMFGDDDL